MKTLSPLKIINFRKNFGQTAALDAGLKEARAEYVITMDGDLQNDPVDIPGMIEYLEQNDLDIVSGWRRKRYDSFSKRFISRGAHLLRRMIINDGIHDSGCSLKVYRQECLAGLDLYGEMHRFIPALLKIKGYSIGEIVVSHHPRVSGETKYSYSRAIKGFLDMLSVWFWKKYSSRPLHLFGTVGFILIFMSLVSGGRAVYGKLVHGFDLSNTVLTEFSMFGFLMGIQFLVFGLLADMLSKVYFSRTKDAPYSIEKIIENK